MCLFGRVELQTEHPRYVRVNNSLGNFRSRESVPGNLFKYKNVVVMDISRCDAVSRTLKFPSIQWIAPQAQYIKICTNLSFEGKKLDYGCNLMILKSHTFLTPSNNCA